jgi:hypothetical protein
MFKPLLFNRSYEFMMNGTYRVNGELKDSSQEFIEVEVDEKTLMFSRTWLALIAHYEVDLPVCDLAKIAFVRSKSKVMNIKCGQLMIFRSPIVDRDHFHVIPGFTKFSINKHGNVRSRKTGKILNQTINPYGYPCVHLYDSDKGSWRPVTVHLLLARVFVTNPDPEVLIFVNHKNGNKLDFRIPNLEWVSSAQNVKHAVLSNLRKDNCPCQLRDVLTEKITHHPSISDAFHSLNLKKTKTVFPKQFNDQQLPLLIKGRYELKTDQDNRGWFYNRDNVKLYQQRLTGIFQAKNLETGKILESTSARSLSKLTNVSVESIRRILLLSLTEIIGGFLFRIKTDQEWPSVYVKSKFKPKRRFSLVNTETGEHKSFDSFRKTYSFLDIDKRTLQLKLNSNNTYERWKIKEIF